MLGVRCPICDTQMRVQSVADLPYFPFCSERCKTIDLGRWLATSYSLKKPAQPEEPDESAEMDTP
jgi:endogenous inhibitor of DNA gyrase (YacG/DUF329 family)